LLYHEKEMKNVFSVVAGLLAAIISELILVKLITSFFMPGVDLNDAGSLKAAILKASTSLLIMLIAGNAISAFLGAMTASRISGTSRQGLTVTVIFLTVCIINNLSYPYPTWNIFASGVWIFLAGYGGTRVGRKKQ
jgi:hypothetical protein